MLRNDQLDQWDHDHFFHPSTHLAQFARGELKNRIITGGEGVHITDRDGNRLLDAFAGLYCVNIGYGRQEVAEAIAAFDTEEEALNRANDTEYGLVAYLHTQDPRRIYRASRALQFGMVAVNRTKVTGAPIPFGGMKQSGLEREGSRLGMEAFTDVKYVCRDWA